MDDDSVDDGMNLSYCPITTTLFRPNMSTQDIVQQTSETTSPLSGETYFSLHLIAKIYNYQQLISSRPIFIVIFICYSPGDVEFKVNFKFTGLLIFLHKNSSSDSLETLSSRSTLFLFVFLALGESSSSSVHHLCLQPSNISWLHGFHQNGKG